jgi:hypothetical protein
MNAWIFQNNPAKADGYDVQQTDYARLDGKRLTFPNNEFPNTKALNWHFSEFKHLRLPK